MNRKRRRLAREHDDAVLVARVHRQVDDLLAVDVTRCFHLGRAAQVVSGQTWAVKRPPAQEPAVADEIGERDRSCPS